MTETRINLPSGNVLVIIERPGPIYSTVSYSIETTRAPQRKTAAHWHEGP